MEAINAQDYVICFNEDGYSSLNAHLLKNRYSMIFVIVDDNTSEHCLPNFLAQVETDLKIEIIEVDAGEASKSIQTCVQVWEALTELGADRKSLIINVGGGMISDLGGFIASTYKRGIDFIHVPTSLLGMVDASIGGKNGIDLGTLKNQIGVINPPKMVLIDTSFLTTLDAREILSGLAEMLKHGLIYDENYWKSFSDLSNLDYATLEILIYRSVDIKTQIVTQDPTEQNIRKSLNFGHTIGHAIESYFLEHPTYQKLLHGEAVACGMILEAHLSCQNNLLSLEDYLEIKNLIMTHYDQLVFTTADRNAILELMKHDKKNEYGKINFSLLNGIGKISINQFSDNEQIKEAFDDYET